MDTRLFWVHDENMMRTFSYSVNEANLLAFRVGPNVLCKSR